MRGQEGGAGRVRGIFWGRGWVLSCDVHRASKHKTTRIKHVQPTVCHSHLNKPALKITMSLEQLVTPESKETSHFVKRIQVAALTGPSPQMGKWEHKLGK